MCGIVGYVGGRDASKVVLEGLKILEYRGYDSCGIATFDSELEVRKDRGMIDEVDSGQRFLEMKGTIGIGHTRWATHGPPSRENSHPHTDCTGEIAIVHNGIISNYLELRKSLADRGHTFTSETDSEVLAHLIEEQHADQGLEEAVISALESVEGSYAVLAVSSREPGRIICARHESPLLLGLGEGECFLGSDISAFLGYTKGLSLLMIWSMLWLIGAAGL